MYDDLFAVIGTSFGSASGTTFNVPDFRGRAPLGTGTGTGNTALDADGGSAPSGGSALTSRELGEWGGQETFQIASANLPTHAHTVDISHGHADNFAISPAAHDHINGDFDRLLKHTGTNTTAAMDNNDTASQEPNVGASATINSQTLSITGGVTDLGTTNKTSSDGGFANTALTFQQRAMPFLCVNYIIAT